MRLTVLLPGLGFPRLRSSVALLRSRGRVIVVDSGACADRPELQRALAGEGVAAGEVEVVVSTHLHYDHCGNHLLFENARFVVSRPEYDDTRAFLERYREDPTPHKDTVAAVLRERNESIKEFYVRSIVREVERNRSFYDALLAADPRFQVIDGPGWLTDEVEVLLTPGHTRGHLSVVAHGAAEGGRPVLLAGDALFTRDSLEEGGDAKLHLVADAAEYRRTRAALLERFRYVVPGHGVLVDRMGTAEARTA